MNLMKRLFALALFSSFVLSACVPDELGPEEIQSTQAALDDPWNPGGTSCSIASTPPGVGPLINGSMNGDGECCGVALCLDEESCGTDYGEYIRACYSCYAFDCLLGEPPLTSDEDEDWWEDWGGTLPPVYNPRNGANAP